MPTRIRPVKFPVHCDSINAPVALSSGHCKVSAVISKWRDNNTNYCDAIKLEPDFIVRHCGHFHHCRIASVACKDAIKHDNRLRIFRAKDGNKCNKRPYKHTLR